jgi:hypothetical protein
MTRVITCLGMVSILLLTSFVSKVYAAEDFPTSDLGVSPSVVGASGEFNEVKITVSGFPGQTGESVTDVDLTPSPCSTQNDITCIGSSHIAIPGIGEGRLLIILHNHKADENIHPVVEATALFLISAALLFIPSVFVSAGPTLFAGDETQVTIPGFTTPDIGTGQVTIQLL